MVLLLLRACVRGCLRGRHRVSADLHAGVDPSVECFLYMPFKKNGISFYNTR
jgi:hypothetical protein